MGANSPALLLVGCGKMGGALLERAAGKKPSPFSAVHVIEPAAPPDKLKSIAGVTWHKTFGEIDKSFNPDLTVIAVKPQQMAETLPAYARFKTGVFLSIAAGITIAKLTALLGGAHPIVRTMPNLPASIGKGITAATPNTQVTPEQRALCDGFLTSVGDVVWLEDERLMDAITALSANGPAYVFALCESMAKAGEALGLAPDMAMHLARQTVIGGGALLEQSPETAETLRRAVTSPGGTTEAALKQLLAESGGLNDLMLKAIAAGAKRAKELAQ